MSADAIASVLPNLSIGVVCIIALVYVTREFLKKLDERESAMRILEKDIRERVTLHLMENTNAMLQHSQVMGEVVHELARIHRR